MFPIFFDKKNHNSIIYKKAKPFFLIDDHHIGYITKLFIKKNMNETR
jgi:hypothetical protein